MGLQISLSGGRQISPLSDTLQTNLRMIPLSSAISPHWTPLRLISSLLYINAILFLSPPLTLTVSLWRKVLWEVSIGGTTNFLSASGVFSLSCLHCVFSYTPGLCTDANISAYSGGSPDLEVGSSFCTAWRWVSYTAWHLPPFHSSMQI